MKMHLLTVIFVGIIANVDNLAIGCSYGIKQTKIPFVSNLFIALMSMICALVGLLAGHWITAFVKPVVANALGGGLLVIIGGLTVCSTFFERKQQIDETSSNFFKVIYQPKKADLDMNNTISVKESIFLGLALALNSITTSFSVGLTDPSFGLYVLSIGIFSLLTIWVGTLLGNQINALLKNLEIYGNIIAGVLLILIGLYEIIK